MFSEGYHSIRPHADATVLVVPCLQTDPLVNNAIGMRWGTGCSAPGPPHRIPAAAGQHRWLGSHTPVLQGLCQFEAGGEIFR